VTSGLRRTVETAELVLEAAGGPAPEIESWTGLHEIRSGDLAAVADDDLERVFLDFLVPPVSLDDPFLEGETFRDLRERVDPAVDRLLAGSWGTLLLVAHGGVNRVILSRALTEGKVMLGNLEQHPGCLNVLDVDFAPGGRERWAVHLVGWTPPDPVHAGRDTTTMEDMLVEYRAAGRRQ
jgi:probable phosphoglycerate mutase